MEPELMDTSITDNVCHVERSTSLRNRIIKDPCHTFERNGSFANLIPENIRDNSLSKKIDAVEGSLHKSISNVTNTENTCVSDGSFDDTSPPEGATDSTNITDQATNQDEDKVFDIETSIVDSYNRIVNEYKQNYQKKTKNSEILSPYLEKKHQQSEAQPNGEELPNICIICNESFLELSQLKEHFKCHGSVHKENYCNICNKTFKQAHLFTKHKCTKSGEKPYLCQICNSSFGDLNNLKRHLLKHTGERPHKCEICEKTFSMKGDLKRHSQIHSEEAKVHVCDECGKGFYRPEHLKRHFSTLHLREKPHTCPLCGKAFALPENMKKHLKLHTGYRPHSCDLCGRSFSQAHNLKVHIERHNKKLEKSNYECKICGEKFTALTSLEKHVVQHSDTAFYQCGRCERNFRRPREISEHRCYDYSQLTGGVQIEIPHVASTKTTGYFQDPSQMDYPPKNSLVENRETITSVHDGSIGFTEEMSGDSMNVSTVPSSFSKDSNQSDLQTHSQFNYILKEDENGTNECETRNLSVEHNDSRYDNGTNSKVLQTSEHEGKNNNPDGNKSVANPHSKSNQGNADAVQTNFDSLTSSTQSNHSSSDLEEPGSHDSPKYADYDQFSRQDNSIPTSDYTSKINELLNRNTNTPAFEEHANYQRSIVSDTQQAPINLFVCRICSKSFPQLHSLERHIQRHKAGRKFLCPVCNKPFSNSGNLRSHLIVHTGEKAHICQICNIAYSQKSGLKAHMKKHELGLPIIIKREVIREEDMQ